MWEKIKNLGWSVLGLGFFVILVLIIGLFIHGGAWLGEKLYPWLVGISSLAFAALIFIFLPLSIFRKTRSFAGNCIMVTSYVFGATLWVWALLLTYYIWGGIAVFIGLFLLGIGVVPIAMFATGFKGMWPTLGELVLLTVLTFGARLLGAFVLEKAQDIVTYVSQSDIEYVPVKNEEGIVDNEPWGKLRK